MTESYRKVVYRPKINVFDLPEEHERTSSREDKLSSEK